MPTKKGTASPKRGHLKAARGQDPVAFYTKKIIPALRRHAKENGSRVGDGEFYHVEMSATAFFADTLQLGGSHIRVIQVLQRTRILTLVSGPVTHVAAKKRRSSVWAVNMRRTPEGRDFLEAASQAAEQADRQRRRAAREARISGEPDTTSGGPVEVRHDHRHLLDHGHGDRSGPHHHPTPEEGGDIRWLEEREKRVEFRHHTHVKEREEPNGTAPTAVAREVTEELAGGRPAVLERARRRLEPKPGETASEGRHRRLMNLVVDLEEQVAQLQQENATLRRTKESLEELLETATDPTEPEAEAFLRERGQ